MAVQAGKAHAASLCNQGGQDARNARKTVRLCRPSWATVSLSVGIRRIGWGLAPRNLNGAAPWLGGFCGRQLMQSHQSRCFAPHRHVPRWAGDPEHHEDRRSGPQARVRQRQRRATGLRGCAALWSFAGDRAALLGLCVSPCLRMPCLSWLSSSPCLVVPCLSCVLISSGVFIRQA